MYLLFWQTFIESLSNSQRDHLLLDVLCNGRGSLDYAKQLVANSEDPDPDRPANTNCPNWCICNVCVDMGNEEENNAVKIGPVSPVQKHCFGQGGADNTYTSTM